MSEISFQDAIESSNQLIALIDANKIEESLAAQKMEELLRTMASTRGFFVSLLTGEWKFDDSIPESIIFALSQSEETTCEVLTKNLVMSTCMELTHSQSKDQTSLDGSKQVKRRALYLIERLDLALLTEKLNSMNQAIEAKLNGVDLTESNQYYAFLGKWKYTDEQLAKAKESLSIALGSDKRFF